MFHVAAIDVGSNATRLSVLAVSSTGLCQQHTTKRYALRLGADVFASGRIGPQRAKALVEAFVDIRRRLARARVRTYRAVGTAAMRDAQNGAALAQRIYECSGIHLQIIDGLQESRLARAALLRSVGAAAPDTLLLDLGGGSLELDLAGGAPGSGRSLPLGSVRLLQSMPALRRPLVGTAFAAAQAAVRQRVRRLIGRNPPAPMALGTGGNLDALVRLLPVLPQGPVPRLNLRLLLPLVQRVAALSLPQRQRRLGLRADRADLVVPAALIILELVASFNIGALVVPGTGLRDALVHNLLLPGEPGSFVRRLLGPGSDVAQAADQAERLARQLFELLAAVHGLHPPALQPLHSALFAWYFGVLLDPAAATVHGQYVLGALQNPQLDRRALKVALWGVAAQIPQVRPPVPLRGAPAGDARAAAVLAGILRLAIALVGRGRRRARLEVDLLGDPIVVKAGLAEPLAPAALAPLAAALGRAMVVR